MGDEHGQSGEGRSDRVWQSPALVATFLSGVRGGIPLAAEQIDVMLRLLAALDRPLQRFVDLGSGSGVLAAAIAARFSAAEGLLVDFSEPMLVAARQTAKSYGDRLRVVRGDFASPAWRDAVADRAPFDAVVSGFAIHHSPDERKRALYAEIHDLLAPGGLFINCEHVASASAWGERLANERLVDGLWAHHQRQGGGKTREQIASEFVYRPDKAANLLAPVDEQVAWLREIGYVDADCWLKIFELAMFGGRRRG